MHERRNFILTLLLLAAVAWGVAAWLITAVAPGWLTLPPSVWLHRWASVVAVVLLSAAVIYTQFFEDKLPDDLGRRTAGFYFEQDGLCFAPLVRVVPTRQGQRAEISLYYQNRFRESCEAVIHLRPKVPGSVFSHRGGRDVHFAFRPEGGAYGVVHQPVAVASEYQGEPVEFEVAAAVRWPHGHGDRLRSRRGAPCGTFDVDWAEAYRQSRHELCGEIELRSPARTHLVMPENVLADIDRGEFTIETFAVAT